MANLLNYFLYAAVFVAVVLAVEGAWLALRSATGDNRTVARRLERIRRAGEAAPGAAPARNRLDAWLDRQLPALGRSLVRSRAPFPPRAVLAGALALAVAIGAVLALAGAPAALAGLAGVAGGLAAPALTLSVLSARRQKQFLGQLPQAVDLIARSLQAGHPVAAAMAVVGKQMPDPIGPEFAVVIEEMTYGLEREQALAALVQRFPSPELRMFAASLEVTRESGGNLAEVFLKLAEAIRAKAQLRLKVEALSAEGRLSFWVVSSLPLVVSGAILLIRPTYYGDVNEDPLFWPMMAVAPVMWTIGAGTIWRMVNFKI